MRNASFGPLLVDNRWVGKVFNGHWRPSAAGTLSVVEPATGGELALVGVAGPTDAAYAAQQAAAAQPTWAKLSSRERAEVLRNAAGVLQSNLETLAPLVSRETGGIIPKGQHEVREAVALLHMASGLALGTRGEVLQSLSGRLSYARRIPRGVVGIISPFNFPLILSMRAVAPALAAGNAVVLKPDAQTPLSGGVIIARAFEEAGLPPGVLHVLPGGAEVGQALCMSADIHMIQFTGSTAVGRRVAELAGKGLKRVSLELGGNNALIILDDADLELAVNNAAWGAYLHQGQICMASSRIFVQESILPQFTRMFADKVRQLAVGDPSGSKPVALGPVISVRQLQRVQAIVADSVKAGAKIECGGRNEGLFHEATLLSGVRPGMRAFDEETFGPVASLVAFGTDEDALELANRHEGALAAAVISRSVGRAMRIADQLKAGLIHINDQTVNDDGNNPFGAPGVAGAGSSVGGPADLDEYTRWQWVTVRDTPQRYPF
jgi:benzaldehyde dehydrogenase (NAD)